MKWELLWLLIYATIPSSIPFDILPNLESFVKLPETLKISDTIYLNLIRHSTGGDSTQYFNGDCEEVRQAIANESKVEETTIKSLFRLLNPFSRRFATDVATKVIENIIANEDLQDEARMLIDDDKEPGFKVKEKEVVYRKPRSLSGLNTGNETDANDANSDVVGKIVLKKILEPIKKLASLFDLKFKYSDAADTEMDFRKKAKDKQEISKFDDVDDNGKKLNKIEDDNDKTTTNVTKISKIKELDDINDKNINKVYDVPNNVTIEQHLPLNETELVSPFELNTTNDSQDKENSFRNETGELNEVVKSEDIDKENNDTTRKNDKLEQLLVPVKNKSASLINLKERNQTEKLHKNDTTDDTHRGIVLLKKIIVPIKNELEPLTGLTRRYINHVSETKDLNKTKNLEDRTDKIDDADQKIVKLEHFLVPFPDLNSISNSSNKENSSINESGGETIELNKVKLKDNYTVKNVDTDSKIDKIKQLLVPIKNKIKSLTDFENKFIKAVIDNSFRKDLIELNGVEKTESNDSKIIGLDDKIATLKHLLLPLKNQFAQHINLQKIINASDNINNLRNATENATKESNEVIKPQEKTEDTDDKLDRLQQIKNKLVSLTDLDTFNTSNKGIIAKIVKYKQLLVPLKEKLALRNMHTFTNTSDTDISFRKDKKSALRKKSEQEKAELPKSDSIPDVEPEMGYFERIRKKLVSDVVEWKDNFFSLFGRGKDNYRRADDKLKMPQVFVIKSSMNKQDKDKFILERLDADESDSDDDKTQIIKIITKGKPKLLLRRSKNGNSKFKNYRRKPNLMQNDAIIKNLNKNKSEVENFRKVREDFVDYFLDYLRAVIGKNDSDIMSKFKNYYDPNFFDDIEINDTEFRNVKKHMNLENLDTDHQSLIVPTVSRKRKQQELTPKDETVALKPSINNQKQHVLDSEKVLYKINENRKKISTIYRSSKNDSKPKFTKNEYPYQTTGLEQAIPTLTTTERSKGNGLLKLLLGWIKGPQNDEGNRRMVSKHVENEVKARETALSFRELPTQNGQTVEDSFIPVSNENVYYAGKNDRHHNEKELEDDLETNKNSDLNEDGVDKHPEICLSCKEKASNSDCVDEDVINDETNSLGEIISAESGRNVKMNIKVTKKRCKPITRKKIESAGPDDEKVKTEKVNNVNKKLDKNKERVDKPEKLDKSFRIEKALIPQKEVIWKEKLMKTKKKVTILYQDLIYSNNYP